MNRYLTLMLIASACCGQSCNAYGGWGPAGCPPVGRLVLAQTPANYRWVHRDDAPDEVHLMYGAQQIGGYSYRTGYYLPLVNGEWGKPSVAPIPPPLTGTITAPEAPLFGVDRERLTGTEHYSCSGVRCTRSEAEGFIESHLRDDSRAGQVSLFVRDPERRKTIRAALDQAPELQGSNSAGKVQVYDPDARPNRELLAPFKLDLDERYRTTGFKMVAQAAPTTTDGTSKADSWYEYDGPKQIIEAVRRVDPNYNPNVNPLPTLPSLPSISWEALALGCLALLVGVCVVKS